MHLHEHVRAVSFELLYDNDTLDIVHWQSNQSVAYDSRTQNLPPALTEEEFPRLPLYQPTDIHPDPSSLRGATWADVARFDRFPQYQKLPLELRRLIFEKDLEHQRTLSPGKLENLDIDYYCIGRNRNYLGRPMSTKYPYLLPKVCLASKRTYLEATPVFIAAVGWEVRSVMANRWLTEFLSNVTDGQEEIGFKSLRDIHFSTYHWFEGVEAMGRNFDMQLAKRCPGLKKLTLTFWLKMVTKDRHRGIVMSGQEIIDHYDLKAIFQCKRLKIVRLDCRSWTHHRMDTAIRAKDRLQELGAWISDGFLQQGQTVEVKV